MRTKIFRRLAMPFLLGSATISAALIQCDLSGFKDTPGLKADVTGDTLHVAWQGERGEQLRAAFAVRDGQPVVRELAARKSAGKWIVLGRDLEPEFQVTSGVRRLSEQQMEPLRELNIELTPEVVEREKWNAFWDAPLMIPGRERTNMAMPRKPEEIRRAWAKYQVGAWAVKTEGARLEVSFSGLDSGCVETLENTSI